MKLSVALLSALFSFAAFAGNVVETNVESNGVSAQKFAQVCVRNFYVKKPVTVVGQWNVTDQYHKNVLHQGTIMTYRLVTSVELKDAKFTLSYHNGVEVVKQDLESVWSDKVAQDCSVLPTYEFKMKKVEDKEIVDLVKVVETTPVL